MSTTVQGMAGTDGKGGYSVRLLVVDDCPDMRFLLRLALTGQGHQVTEACARSGAAEAAAMVQPEVVILEGFGPGLDGAGVVQAILLASPRSRVVMFSAADPHSLGARAEAAGAVAAVPKLCGPGAVIDLLDRLLA